MVSEAIFPTNRGYICIEKWSQIFVSGIGSVHSESEKKGLFLRYSKIFTPKGHRNMKSKVKMYSITGVGISDDGLTQKCLPQNCLQ